MEGYGKMTGCLQTFGGHCMCSEVCVKILKCVSLPGDPVVYTHWVPNRKSWNHWEEDCVLLVNGYHGQWEDFECDHHRHYICEFGEFILWFFDKEGAMTSMVTISRGGEGLQRHVIDVTVGGCVGACTF